MGVTVFIDEEDRVGTVLRINALTDREAGTLVAHIPPTAFSTRLPQDVLRAIGHGPATAPDWPRTLGAAWKLARAWCHGFDVHRLILYGAWRLGPRELTQLQKISDEDRIDVALVSLGSLYPRSEHPLLSHPTRPIADLLETRPPKPRTPLPAGGVISHEISPLPAADFAAFLPECAGVLHALEWERLIEAYRRAYDTAAQAIDTRNVRGSVATYLATALRRARNANDILVIWRSLQAAALEGGHLLHIGLAELSQIVALALDTAPENHGRWPAPGPVHPIDHAAAGLAWATAADAESLSALRTSDVDSRSMTVNVAGEMLPIPVPMRPPIRAQRWLKLYDLGDHSPLLSRGRNAPSTSALSDRLDRIAPRGRAALDCGRRLRLELEEKLRVDDVAGRSERKVHAGRRPAPPSDFGNWSRYGARRSEQIERTMGTGPRHEREGGRNLDFVRAQLYVMGGRPIPWRENEREDPSVNDDAKSLHGVLVTVGGRADRVSLLHGLRWKAMRLHEAVAAANILLDGLGERIVELPEGDLELRGYVDKTVQTAVETIAMRGSARDPLSQGAAALLRVLLDADPKGIPLEKLTQDGDCEAVNELVNSRLAIRDAKAVLIDSAVPLAFMRTVRRDAWSRQIPSRLATSPSAVKRTRTVDGRQNRLALGGAAEINDV